MLASPPSPTSQTRTTTMTQPRSNEEWLADLRGQRGSAVQQQAHLELGTYLYKVAYNYLLKRQNDVARLTTLAWEDLTELAQDYVQDVLIKLCENDFARLDQYRGEGRFLAWTALIIRNHSAGILRRPPFTKGVTPMDDMLNHPTTELPHATRLTLQEVGAVLQVCIDALAEARREALVGCVIEGERTKVVAERLQRTVNAVDQLVMHAKRQVKACLRGKGIGPEVLGLWDTAQG